MLTLVVFKSLLCLSSPNFPHSFCCFVFDINQLKVTFADHYLRNEFEFWNVHGIMNTSGLLQSKCFTYFARGPKYS